MTPHEHQMQLLDTIDRVHPFEGADGPLPALLREAFLAVPRHGFIHRYRRREPFMPLQEVTAQTLAEHLPLIYSNTVLLHVGADGEALPSSNSEPAFILRVLEQLDLQPGLRVLEVGSGGGWLAAIMARAVGSAGKVTGVEIIPGLVEQSRRDLASLGIGNIEIVSGDGAFGWPAGALYDRIIVTAACPDIPNAFHEQLRDGGRLVIPVRNRGGAEDVLVLRKRGDRFVMEAATIAYFVPFVGERGLGAADALSSLHELPLWQELRGAPCAERRLWFGGPALAFEWLTAAFRAFLGRVDPEFFVRDERAFGLADPARRSLALFRPYWLTGYGAPDAYERAQAIYRLWCEAGMPAAGGMGLTVYRADAGVRAAEGFPVCRGDSVFVWSLPSATVG
jgi:protein-L-isoaspartate(D-aspartate) O-methyltransferase